VRFLGCAIGRSQGMPVHTVQHETAERTHVPGHHISAALRLGHHCFLSSVDRQLGVEETKSQLPEINRPTNQVSIVSGYGLDDRAIEVRSPAEARGFFL
jgi:hypothetical protein